MNHSFVIKNDFSTPGFALLPTFNLIFVFPDLEICTAFKGRGYVFTIQILRNRLFIWGRLLLDHHPFTKNCDVKNVICIHYDYDNFAVVLGFILSLIALRFI